MMNMLEFMLVDYCQNDEISNMERAEAATTKKWKENGKWQKQGA